MSYARGAALQAAVWQRLTTDPTLAGVAIHDAAPPGPATGTYVTLGPEEVRDASDATGAGALHDFVVAVVTDQAGFAAAKAVAAAVSTALLAAPLALAEGRIAGLWFRRARARRVEDGRMRRIDLTFRARIED